MVRAHWPSILPVLREALAEGAIGAEAALPAMQEALPAGEALVAMIDHPEAAVRRPALIAAIGADHPAVVTELGDLSEDPDAEVARGGAGRPRAGCGAGPRACRSSCSAAFG